MNLTKKSDHSQLAAYFQKIAELKDKKNRFPIKLDEVWALAYTRKDNAIRDLKAGFIENEDFILLKNEEKLKVSKLGRTPEAYFLSLACLEYFIAKKVKPVFEVYRQIFHERIAEEKNPDLIYDRYEKTYLKRGKEKPWIAERAKGRSVRNEFTSTLAAHGVEREGFRDCTNAIYEPLFGGTTTVIRQKLGITKEENIRDNMSKLQLAAVGLAELMATEKIEKQNVFGNADCESASRRASVLVAKAVKENFKTEDK